MVWERLINTEFSSMTKNQMSLNTKDYVVWTRNIGEGGNLLDFQQDKLNDNLMIWGGLSLKGVIPIEALIFIDDFKKINEFSITTFNMTDGQTGGAQQVVCTVTSQ